MSGMKSEVVKRGKIVARDLEMREVCRNEISSH